MKITVVGTGYVGLSMAVLLAQHHEVVALDIDTERVAKLNARQPTIDDADVAQFMAERVLNLHATTNKKMPTPAHKWSLWPHLPTMTPRATHSTPIRCSQCWLTRSP